MPTSRLEAFSDGVFAIAITLLIIEVHVPDAAPGRLAHDLAEQWPSYAAYVVSFLQIGIVWVNHHTLLAHVARTDRTLLFLNLLMLMCVAFIPFPTALLAEGIRRGGSDQHVAAAVYGANMLACAICFSALWHYVSQGHRLLRDSITPAQAASTRRQYWAGTVVYALTIGLAFVSATLVLVIYAAIALFFVTGTSTPERARA
jgi:uncharacterized membrane protein